MLPEHIDVDITTMLLSQNDHFLVEFAVYVCGIGVRKSQRDGGKHLTARRSSMRSIPNHTCGLRQNWATAKKDMVCCVASSRRGRNQRRPRRLHRRGCFQWLLLVISMARSTARST